MIQLMDDIVEDRVAEREILLISWSFFCRKRRQEEFAQLLHFHVKLFHEHTNCSRHCGRRQKRVSHVIQNCNQSVDQLGLLESHVDRRET